MGTEQSVKEADESFLEGMVLFEFLQKNFSIVIIQEIYQGFYQRNQCTGGWVTLPQVEGCI